MANFGGELKQALLIALYESAVNSASPLTLQQTITNQVISAASAVSSGTFVTDHSANGHSTSRQAAGWSGLNPSEVASFAAELRNLYTICRDALIEEGTDAPTDAQIFDEMVFQLSPVRSMRNDHSALSV